MGLIDRKRGNRSLKGFCVGGKEFSLAVANRSTDRY